MSAADPHGSAGAGAGPGAACHDGVCVTCSDSAVAVTVVELLDQRLAVVDTGEWLEEVSVGLVRARVGDTLLVHAGEALAVVRSEGTQP